MKKILALHTGGTISMSQSSQGVKANASNPIANRNLDVNYSARIINEELFNVSSQMITLDMILKIKQKIVEAKRKGFDGAIVTHGTDTLEETAYFLDLTITTDNFPIVVTGAMRSSNEIGSDGLRNFSAAIQVVTDDRSKSQGVLVVMNDEIHSARYVTKTHTVNLDTFKSPLTGKVGMISNKRLYFFQSFPPKLTYDIDYVIDDVYLIKTYSGMGDTLFNSIDKKDTKGVVIEGLGAGNVPPATLPAIRRLLKHNIPIILVSRCVNGMVEDIYNDNGGGFRLQKMGLVLCRGLNGQKARIKLIIGLSAGLNNLQLKEYMKDTK